MIICFAIAAVVNEKNNSMEFGTGGVYEVNISEIGANEIPAEFVDIYKRAGEKYGIPWTLLAAEHRVETTFSSNLSDSSVGAVGHFQFMPKTWIGWGYPGGNRVGNLDIPKDKLTDPKLIKKYGGYGVDANNDGKADPWDLEDAAFLRPSIYETMVEHKVTLGVLFTRTIMLIGTLKKYSLTLTNTQQDIN